jgi:hypothetical protein
MVAQCLGDASSYLSCGIPLALPTTSPCPATVTTGDTENDFPIASSTVAPIGNAIVLPPDWPL